MDTESFAELLASANAIPRAPSAVNMNEKIATDRVPARSRANPRNSLHAFVLKLPIVNMAPN